MRMIEDMKLKYIHRERSYHKEVVCKQAAYICTQRIK